MSFSERIAAILETKEISEFYEFHGQNTKRMPNAVISKKTYFGVYDLLRECWKKSFNTSLDFVADLKTDIKCTSVESARYTLHWYDNPETTAEKILHMKLVYEAYQAGQLTFLDEKVSENLKLAQDS
jgi:hypothetical protein